MPYNPHMTRPPSSAATSPCNIHALQAHTLQLLTSPMSCNPHPPQSTCPAASAPSSSMSCNANAPQPPYPTRALQPPTPYSPIPREPHAPQASALSPNLLSSVGSTADHPLPCHPARLPSTPSHDTAPGGVLACQARPGHLFLTIPHACLFLPPPSPNNLEYLLAVSKNLARPLHPVYDNGKGAGWKWWE